MLDPHTLILRINEMHQALATLPVVNLDAAIDTAFRYTDAQINTPKPSVITPTETVGVIVSALSHSSYYNDRTYCYPVLIILRALYLAAQEQHIQWASQLTPWSQSIPDDLIPDLIANYSQMSIFGLVGTIATESRDDDPSEYIQWLHRALMHISIFAYLRGIDLISELRDTFRACS